MLGLLTFPYCLPFSHIVFYAFLGFLYRYWLNIRLCFNEVLIVRRKVAPSSDEVIMDRSTPRLLRCFVISYTSLVVIFLRQGSIKKVFGGTRQLCLFVCSLGRYKQTNKEHAVCSLFVVHAAPPPSPKNNMPYGISSCHVFITSISLLVPCVSWIAMTDILYFSISCTMCITLVLGCSLLMFRHAKFINVSFLLYLRHFSILIIL